MAVTSIKSTRNIRESLEYALEDEAHTEGSERYEIATGVNCDPVDADRQMRITRQAHGKDGINSQTGKEFVQGYTIVQSFDPKEFDYKDPLAVAQANEIGVALAKDLYPEQETVVVTQIDGKGRKVHNHIVVSSVNFQTGKQLRDKAVQWENVAERSDQILRDFGKTPLKSVHENESRGGVSNAEYALRDREEYVWKDDLKDRVASAMSDPRSLDIESYESVLSEQGVTPVFRSENKEVKRFKYTFEDANGEERELTNRKMGQGYLRDDLNDKFAENKLIAETPKETKNALDNIFDNAFSSVVVEPTRKKAPKEVAENEDEEKRKDEEAMKRITEEARRKWQEQKDIEIAQKDARLLKKRQAEQARVEAEQKEKEELEALAEDKNVPEENADTTVNVEKEESVSDDDSNVEIEKTLEQPKKKKYANSAELQAHRFGIVEAVTPEKPKKMQKKYANSAELEADRFAKKDNDKSSVNEVSKDSVNEVEHDGGPEL